MKFFKIIFFLLVFTSFASASQEFIKKEVDGKNVRIIKVELDRGHKIITSVAKDQGKTVMDLVDKVGGVSGVNGAYFCPKDYKQCGGIDYTNADRIFEGQNYSRYWPDTGGRGIFGFDKDGNFLFVQNHLGFAEGAIRNINVDKMTDIYYGISNHPVILYNGRNMLTDEDDKLMDAKITSYGPKNFICINKDQDEVYMGYIGGIYIYEMPAYLYKNFGCRTAINLDSGRSTGIVFENKSIIKAWRPVMDAFVVLESPEYKTLSSDERYYITQYTANYLNSYRDRNDISALLLKIDRVKARIQTLLSGEHTLKKRAVLFEIQKNVLKVEKRTKSDLTAIELANLYKN